MTSLAIASLRAPAHFACRPLTAIAVSALFIGCGGASDGPSTPTIGPGHVATITISGIPSGSLVAGQLVSVTVTTFDRDHQVLTGFPVSWTTSDTIVAKVAPTPVGAQISARNPGTATVSAYSDNQKTSFVVTVVPIPVATVKLSQTNATLYTGGSVRVTASALDSLGRALVGRAIAWSSSNSQVVRVDTGGVVSAVGPGSATITAASEGKSSSLPVTVIARPVSDWSAVAEDWLNYQANSRHTGYVPATIDPVSFVELWSATPVPGTGLNPITVADGRVYASTNAYFGKQILTVLDANTGGIQWTHDFGAIHSVDPPTYANGSVYVATGGHEDSFIWAFNVSDGSTRFRTAYGNQWSRWFAPVVIGDTLFMAGGYYGGMYAFATTDGHQLWFTGVNQYDMFTPAVKDGLVYAHTGSYSPKLTVANSKTGAVVYEIADPHFNWDGWSMNTAPVLGDANDVIDAQGGRLLSFDLVKRQIGWEITGGYAGQPAVANGVIYVTKSGQVEAHRESDGGLLWTWVPPAGSVTGPMIVTKNILLATTATATYAIDLGTHGNTWSYPAGGQIAISKSGTLFLAQTTGKIAAIKLR